MAHNDAVISKMVFQKPDGVTGSLEVHDGDALHGIDGVVTTDLIADKAVTNGKIAEDAVTSAEIAEGAVGTGEIADGVITVDKFSPELKEVWDSKSQHIERVPINEVIPASTFCYLTLPEIDGMTCISVWAEDVVMVDYAFALTAPQRHTSGSWLTRILAGNKSTTARATICALYAKV